MNTITAVVIDHEPVEFLIDGVTIPVVVGFGPTGAWLTARELAERETNNPLVCNHSAATWSSNLDMRCPDCGSPMFIPPKLLAYLTAETIAAMKLLWKAAGWPAWSGNAWSIIPDKWTIFEHPFFDHCGGLPVRNDRTEKYYDALFELAADDAEVTR